MSSVLLGVDIVTASLGFDVDMLGEINDKGETGQGLLVNASYTVVKEVTINSNLKFWIR